MDILKVAHRVPWPLNSGSKIHTYNDLKEISKSNDVTLAVPYYSDEEKLGLKEIKKFCNNTISAEGNIEKRSIVATKSILKGTTYRTELLRSYLLKEKIENLLSRRKFDVIWVHYLSTLNNLPTGAIENNTIILDQHDSLELVWEKYLKSGTITEKIFAYINRIKVKRVKNKYAKNIDIILSTSKRDALYERKSTPKDTKVLLEPNGVDLEYYNSKDNEVSEANNPTIIFCGSMDVKMNSQAAVYFTNNIFPQIKRKKKDVEFYVVGKNPVYEVRRLGNVDGVTVTGTVPDVRPYYRDAWVSVAPFKLGGGSKLKILEAMAMGVPVVSTSTGCQGVEVEFGTDLILANSEKEFERRVVELIENKDLRKEISFRCRKIVENKYSWKAIVSETMSSIDDCV